MGVMSINIFAQEIPNPSGDGKIGIASVSSLGNCSSSWTFSAKTQSSCWVEWSNSGSATLTISKTNGNNVAVNGETLTEITEYSVNLDAWASPNGTLNTLSSQFTMTLRNGDGGSVLDSKTVTRFHTNSNC